MLLVAEDESIEWVPYFPEDGQRNGRTDIGVEAKRRCSLPKTVDGDRCHDPCVNLHQSDVKHWREMWAASSQGASHLGQAEESMMCLWCKFSLELSMSLKSSHPKILTLTETLVNKCNHSWCQREAHGWCHCRHSSVRKAVHGWETTRHSTR